MSRIEDECTVWSDTAIEGSAARFGYVDKQAYRDRLTQERRESKRVMAPFIQWLQSEMKTTDVQSRREAAIVWLLLKETENNPVDYIMDTTIKRQSRAFAKAAVRNFCTYMIANADRYPKGDIIWAKSTLKKLMAPIPMAQDLGSTQGPPRPTKVPPRPLYPREYRAAVKAWKEYSYKTGMSAQRYAAGMLVFATGIKARELMLLTKADIEHLLETGNLRIISWSIDKNRVIPIKGLEDECRLLLGLPVEWSTLADLVAPRANPTDRVERASAIIARLFREGVVEPLGLPRKSIMTRIRHFLGYVAWRRGEPILAQQYLGYVSQDRLSTIVTVWEGRLYTEEWDPEEYDDLDLTL